MNSLKCGADVTDTYEPDDYSVGITAGWYCDGWELGDRGARAATRADDRRTTFQS